MKILIACEESQAYSCDILPESGGHPEWHIQGDALDNLEGWDFFGAHPVCKYLTNSGVGWLVRKKPTKGFEWSEKYNIYMNFSRYEKMVKGALFFNKMLDAVKKTGRGYVENPIMHKYAKEIITEPYTQIIQPFQFGHPERKATCLWLVGLAPLEETDNVEDIMRNLPKKEAQRIHYMSPGPDREKLRSKTFPRISNAMAAQWG